MRNVAVSLMAVLLLIPVGCGEGSSPDTGSDIVQPVIQERPSDPVAPGEVEVFFAGSDATLKTAKIQLGSEERSREERIRELAEAVINGPEPTSTLVPVFPAGVSIRAVFTIEGEVAVVDLEGNGIRDWNAGSTQEILAVYALVNTIAANVEGIAAVQLLVDGHEVETLAGHVDLTRPLRPRNI